MEKETMGGKGTHGACRMEGAGAVGLRDRDVGYGVSVTVMIPILQSYTNDTMQSFVGDFCSIPRMCIHAVVVQYG